ncbi:pitrilysin family protein [Deltaproteobacteria bacterium IMCC39524]|nr:pitrilysin family protein [Deltaproteobacteria bacterium IMCC39524]
MMYLRQLQLCLVGMTSALVFSGCGAPLPTSYQQLEYPDLTFQLPEVETLVLDNGIRLYLKADDELPLVQVTAMIGSGGISSAEEKTGFDDLFGSVWRSGGAGDRTPEALDEYLDFLAANLSSSMDTYSSQLDLSLRSADLPAGLSILSDLLLRPGFDSERLELARLQAQEHLRRQNDNPGSISRRLLMKALYPGHYLGRTATEQSLAAITRQDLVDFHDTYFAPNNLWIAVSGDFDRDTLLEALNKELGDWPQGHVPEQQLPPVKAPDAGLIQLAAKDLSQTSILIGDLGLSKENPDQYAVRVLNYILGGGGFNSRMMREIRSNRGLAYSAYSYFQVGRRLPGPFVAGTETKNESVVPALSLTREIMNDLRDTPVTDEELQLAKESQINSFVFGFENTHSVVSQQMSLAFFEYPANYLADYRDKIAAVTIADVQRVAQEFIDPSRQQIVLVGNPEEFSDELKQFGLPVIEVDLNETP